MSSWLAGLAAAVAVLLLVRKSSGPTTTRGVNSAPVDPVDPLADKDLATSCDPTPKPGVLMFRQYILDRFGQRDGSPQNITRSCGERADEHQEGRAWDCMTRDLSHGQAIVDHMTANDNEVCRRAGIMYMIWNRNMWRSYSQAGAPPGSWGAYSGSNPHTDHVHFSFSRDGANAKTSLYATLRGGFPSV